MPIKKSISIIDLIKDSAGFALRGSNVNYEISIAEDLWPIEVDEGQISQVIHNIAINANQAMPRGGTIEICCANLLHTGKAALPLPEGKYIKISIKDQGTGIPEKHLARIFDPYFTTKQRGSGLGLATAFSIIKKHNGHINVESQINKGTVFHIYLPASEKAAASNKKGATVVTTGAGKILLMDDEEMIREVAKIMLTDLGYEVDLACDGREAIQIYQKAKSAGNPFDLVIMDLTIPGGMGGIDAIKKLRQLDPDVKAIVSSGYSTDPVMANYRDYGFVDVIMKPYRAHELVEVLKRAMAQEQNSPVK